MRIFLQREIFSKNVTYKIKTYFGENGNMIKIHGFNKLTLLDYPEKMAATIFLGHCNFRCPFCQNGGLVLNPEAEPVIPVEDVLKVLKKRQGILDGVCITGGEPTLHSDLPEFIAKIKKLGYAVKLDTNGSRPKMIKYLVEQNLIDYVAMDIKNAPSRYGETVGVSQLDFSCIEESVAFLMSGAVDYEFRTTVARELHTEAEFKQIGEWIAGCKRYFLQGYQESGQVIRPVFTSYTRGELEQFREILLETISCVEIRGV